VLPNSIVLLAAVTVIVLGNIVTLDVVIKVISYLFDVKVPTLIVYEPTLLEFVAVQVIEPVITVLAISPFNNVGDA
jgi:hypothetical protein